MKLSRITTLLMLFLSTIVLALPTFAQDATAEATSSADLQTYRTEKGDASVQFPAGWVSENGGDITSILSVKLANNQSALAKELFNKDDVFQAGEVHIEVAAISLPELVKEMPAGSITLDATPLDLVQALAKQGMPDEFKFGNPGAITINDRPAVRMNITAEKRGEGQLLVTIVDKQWVEAIILYAAPGEGDKWDITARDILASIKISPQAEATLEPTHEPTRTQTYTSAKGKFMLAYPAKLIFEDRSDGIPDGFTGGFFYTNSSLKAKTFADDFQSGDLYIDFALTTISNYETLLGNVDSSSPSVDILRKVIDKTGVPSLTYGTVSELSVPYGSVAQVNISGKGKGEGRFVLIKRASDGLFITLVIHTAPGEIQLGIDAALSIAASLTRIGDQPVVESTAEPVALTQSIKLNNGLGVVSYPEKWFTRQYQTQSIYISNSQAALEKSFGSAMAAGQVNILVTMSSADDYIKQAQLPAKSDASPLELLQLTLKSVGDSGTTFATPEATTIGDKKAARVDFKSKEFEGTAWLIEYQKGAIVAVQMLAAPGESQHWQSTALAIAASVRSTD